MNNPDPRLNLPSASSFTMDFACPGRRQLLASITTLATQEPDTDEEAERGTRIHKARETGNTLPLDADDLEIYNSGIAQEKKILAQWKEDFGIQTYREGPREERIYLHDPITFDPVSSGMLDVHYVSINPPGYIAIIEWKSLYCTSLPPAEKSWQGKMQVVLIAQEYDETNHVRFVFNKALLERTDTVDYQLTDIEQARNSIFFRLWECKQPDAPRYAGKHCRYCPARNDCQEAGAFAMLPSVRAPWATGMKPKERNAQLVEMVGRLTLPDLIKIWRTKGTVTKILEATNDRLKTFPDDELRNEGLIRVPGRKLDPIVDAEGLYEFLEKMGMEHKDIMDCFDASKAKLSVNLQIFKGIAEDSVKKFIENDLAQFIEKKESEKLLKEA